MLQYINLGSTGLPTQMEQKFMLIAKTIMPKIHTHYIYYPLLTQSKNITKKGGKKLVNIFVQDTICICPL